MRILFSLVLLLIICGCNNADDFVLPENDDFYFPPIGSSEWETTSPESLGWNTDNIDDLYTFLTDNNTRAFIVLKDGKIVIEKYWGNDILDLDLFSANSNWYWASAGKSLTAFLVGIAQEEGLLDINNKTSDYLGNGWTSLPSDKEDLITVRNQLTMSTGLDYTVTDLDCTLPSCLEYREDAGNQWFYHNGPYTLLESVVSNTAGITYNQYTEQKVESLIGMNGTWIPSGSNNVYWSTPRDAARFGLLISNNGDWGSTSVLADKDYINSMVNTSQDLNPSYGYLWWLNGKPSLILPGLSTSFNFSISPEAPADLFAAMGKNGQFIDIVPSQGLVVVRMGEAPDDSLVPILFHDDMWEQLMTIVD